jgi:hypothetical protein
LASVEDMVPDLPDLTGIAGSGADAVGAGAAAVGDAMGSMLFGGLSFVGISSPGKDKKLGTAI